jgi:hypothetical protein
VIDLTESGDDGKKAVKLSRGDLECYSFSSSDSESSPSPQPVFTVEHIVLTPAQQSVVDLAVAGHNIFLTGAARSGKPVTLKRMEQCLKMKLIHFKLSIVAPTGIAALPLNGKTTYSFAGWTPDPFQHPMENC